MDGRATSPRFPAPITGALHNLLVISVTVALGLGLAPRASAQGGSEEVPRIYGNLPEASVRNLRVGYSLALRMLQPAGTCASLFEPLSASGLESLTSTFYAVPAGSERTSTCRRGAVAFTVPGSRVTKLCPRYGALHPRDAALVLVHEALHAAGLPERPPTPEAASSEEIDLMVERVCAGAGRARGGDRRAHRGDHPKTVASRLAQIPLEHARAVPNDVRPGSR